MDHSGSLRWYNQCDSRINILTGLDLDRIILVWVDMDWTRLEWAGQGKTRPDCVK